MNFKNRGDRMITEKYQIEEIIDKGIKLFNEKNNENIPFIGEYNYSMKNINYSFSDEGILLSWEEEDGRPCGGYQEYKNEEKNIPYFYFKKNNSEIKINEDLKIRDDIKLEIEKIKKENIVLEHEEREHRKHLFAAKDIKRKYNAYIDFRDIEKELKKCEALVLINSDKIKELEEDLK